MATSVRSDSLPHIQNTGPLTTAAAIDLEDKIGSLDATEIELLGISVVNQILSNLGYAPKLRILQKELEIRGDYCGIRAMAIQEQRRLVAYGTGEFLTGMNVYRFTNFMLDPVKVAITQAFSTSLNFMEKGVAFELSNAHSVATGILGKATREMAISIFPAQLPSRYQIILTINQELSQEQRKLVFTLTEMSNYAIFSTKNVTIEEIASSLQLQ